MNAKALGLITLVLAMIVAALAAPLSAGAQFEDSMTMRAWAKDDFSQMMVAVEQDARTPRFAAEVYDELTPFMLEQSFGFTIEESYRASRSDLREAGVSQMRMYNGFTDADDTFGIIIVAQDGRYVYVFVIMEVVAGSANGQLDTDAAYEVLIDTSEFLLVSISTPRGWMDITDMIEDDLPFGGSSL